MGDLIEISCSSCPYSGQFLLGFGELGLGFDVMICQVCREVVSVPVDGDPTAYERFTGELVRMGLCPTCEGRKLWHVETDGPGNWLEPADTDELCPYCRQGNLLARKSGLWD